MSDSLVLYYVACALARAAARAGAPACPAYSAGAARSYFVCTWAGILVSPFFFAGLLLDIMQRFESLANVVRAVTYNARQLLMTLFLGLTVMYLFSIVGFNFMRGTCVTQTHLCVLH